MRGGMTAEDAPEGSVEPATKRLAVWPGEDSDV